MQAIWKILKGICLTIGVVTLLTWVVGFVFLLQFKPEAPKLAESNILYLDFAKPLLPKPLNDPLAALFEEGIDLFSLTESIRRAGNDDRIHGIVADVRYAALTPAEIEEIAFALQTFKKSNKFTIAFADTLGEGGNATWQYYLASQFNEIWLQPTGGLDILGFGAAIPFFKNTLDAIGIETQFFKRKDYKTALNQLTETNLTPAHREELQSLLDAMTVTFGENLKVRRPNAPPVQNILEKGFFTAEEAVAAKLIDHLGYWDEVLSKANGLLGEDMEWINAQDYAAALNRGDGPQPLQKAEQTIALVYAVGPIMRGSPEGEGYGEGDTVYADILADDIASAVESEEVSAIVLRVDSPGGSYTASDTVRREILKAKEAKIPVIVSMGSVAASGGYYIAMDGDQIFANPTTITGSIGVFGGKIVYRQLAEKLEVTWDSIKAAPHALAWSPASPFSEEAANAFNASIDRIYADFTQKVATARNIADIESLAQGKVFVGSDALQNGLIDKVGGLRQALEAAKVAIGLTPDTQVHISVYPKAEDDWQKLLQRLGSVGVAEFGPLATFAQYVRLWNSGGALALAPMGVWE